MLRLCHEKPNDVMQNFTFAWVDVAINVYINRVAY